MTGQMQLLERVREQTETKTDYATAKALGITQSTLLDIKKGRQGLGNEACFRAAELLGEDAAHVIAAVEIDKAKTEQKREFWKRQLPRSAPSLAHASVGAAEPAALSGGTRANTARHSPTRRGRPAKSTY